ncbi:MAG: hypothetical protein A2987_00200 [Omnitrophica bacterium RIFCSPLOWO2_01_FULL_45_10]|nr:MAG: hypothetical protein A2987_00200 [Omnitrophica bacterium RIFCSPLOWO2_01_FULL_45_10]
MLRIILGDLRHRTVGRNSAYFPLGIGLIASYCKNRFGNDIECRLCDDPDSVLQIIDSWKPHVIGLANYMWNAEINNLVFDYAKSADPDIACVAGGPDFPISAEESEKYLKKRRSIDFYCLLEGEIAFSDLISKTINGMSLKKLKSNPVPGTAAIDPKKKSIVYGKKAARIADLNVVPSPYLSGIFDQYFNGEYIPAVQTARGCPYSCKYCRASNPSYSKVVPFDLKRVKEEIAYIAKKSSQFKVGALLITDSNFGIMKRDLEIAKHIRKMQDEYDWPKSIQADTAKNNYDRVFEIANILKKKMPPLCSLQTTNEATLKVIKRENLPYAQYDLAQKKLIALNIIAGAELIIPMPLETKKSFLETLRKVYSSGIEYIRVFTWMLLPGTELASTEYRKKYRLMTGYRIIPRQFGVYKRKKCFEIEEICYETSTMPFEEYVQCRGYAFLCFLLGRSQYDVIRRIIAYFSLDSHLFLIKIFECILTRKSAFTSLFQELLEETKNEIFSSPSAIYKAYSKKKNYEKLLRGEVGDNLFRKYLVKALLDTFQSSVDLIFETITNLLKEKGIFTEIEQEFLAAAKTWMLISRDFSGIFRDYRKASKVYERNFPFDINKWYCDIPQHPIGKYHYKVKARFYYDKKFIEDFLRQIKRLYGEDVYYSLGKTLFDYNPDIFWKKCQVLA